MIHLRCLFFLLFRKREINKVSGLLRCCNFLVEKGFSRIYDAKNINSFEQQPEQSSENQEFIPVQEIELMVAKRVPEELKRHEDFLSEWTLKQEE